MLSNNCVQSTSRAAALEAGPASERRVVSTLQHGDKGVGAHWKQAGIMQNKLGVPQRVGLHITLGAPEFKSYP